MAQSANENNEIRQLARYQVHPESLEKCLAAIQEFVAYVRANEPGTLRYDVWQEVADPTRFVHIFTFRAFCRGLNNVCGKRSENGGYLNGQQTGGHLGESMQRLTSID